jgi:drug/metabolite transporter (DMT)-like permease
LKADKKRNAEALLVINAVIWGSSYVLNKILLRSLPMFTVLFLFSFGGFLFSFLFFRKVVKGVDKKTVLRILLVSSFSVLSNIFCMLSLKRNDSSVTAFVVQSSVVITPFLVSFYEKRKPEKVRILNALVAFSGIFLITVRFEDFQFNFNILFALANALFFSLYLVGQKVLAPSVDSKQFLLVHYLFCSLVFTGPAILEYVRIRNSLSLVSLLPLVLVCTFFAVFPVIAQTFALVFIKPEKAALIYALEPVTALITAALFTGERPDSIKTLAGLFLIFLSLIKGSVSPKASTASMESGKTAEQIPKEKVLG